MYINKIIYYFIGYYDFYNAYSSYFIIILLFHKYVLDLLFVALHINCYFVFKRM
jgi:hypothetical protein